VAKAQREIGRTISGKTAYGTESAFVTENTIGAEVGPDQVLCKDERGYYVTFKERVDSGMADPRRWGNERLTPQICEGIS
jgi:hypothetical protein